MRLRSILTFELATLLPLRGLRRMSLLAVMLLVGCAQAATPEPIQTEMPAQVDSEPSATIAQPEATSTNANSMEVHPTESPAEVPQAVATSRGPNLEATDPTTVSLNSGDLQFVEFFRFT